MKHPTPPTDHWSPQGLHETLQRSGVQATLEQCAALLRHGDMVLEANLRVNLTRITDPNDFIMLHIVDSLAFLPLIPPLTGDVIDLGAGAGFPGIPLAVMGHRIVLCEATQKKARFLEGCVAALGLSATVAAVRAEELAVEAPAAADSVIARAVTSLPALVELSAPLLRLGGRLIALKGAPSAEEVQQAARAAALCGMERSGSTNYALESGERRSVYEYARTGEPRIALPRRPGTAQRQPLG